MNNYFFLDTYAIFEFLSGNPNYTKYKKARHTLTIFNLIELNYNLKKEISKSKADKITSDYYPLATNILLEDIISAMDLKSKNRKLSAPDCIGYTVAKRLGAKFLTGDKAFENIQGVEFVK